MDLPQKPTEKVFETKNSKTLQPFPHTVLPHQKKEHIFSPPLGRIIPISKMVRITPIFFLTPWRKVALLRGRKLHPWFLTTQTYPSSWGAHPPSLRGGSPPPPLAASLVDFRWDSDWPGRAPCRFGTQKNQAPSSAKEEKGDHFRNRKGLNQDKPSHSGGIKFQARFYDSLLMRKIHGVTVGTREQLYGYFGLFLVTFQCLRRFPDGKQIEQRQQNPDTDIA